MESLGLNAGVDALVDNDTDGVLGHIEDTAGLTVVELVLGDDGDLLGNEVRGVETH